MTVFPAYDPIYSAPKQASTAFQPTSLGDGYRLIASFGLNSVASDWNLSWIVEQEAADQIEGFLQARADAGEWFEWQPPDASSTQRWRCDEWTVDVENPLTFRISAVFRRAFELSILTLDPALATCFDDILCEGDYGDIGTDFWVSVMTAPFANAPWFADPSFVGGVDSWSLATDSMGNSYALMSTTTGKFAITKRKLNGEVIWTKEHSFLDTLGAGVVLDSVGESFVCDIGDDKESIICFLPTYFGYQHDNFAVYSSNGEFRLGMSVPADTIPQGHTMGMEYIPLQKYVMMVRHSLGYLNYDVIDANTSTWIAGWVTSYGALLYTSAWSPQASGFVQFDNGTSLLFDKRSGFLLLTRIGEDFTPMSSNYDRYNAAGAGGVAAALYGAGCLVATSEWLFYFDKSGNFISQTSVGAGTGYVRDLQVTEDGIYVYSHGVYPSTYGSMISDKYSLDLTSHMTRNVVAGDNTNFVANDTYGWGADRPYHTPTGRVTGCKSTYSPNAYINTGTYPVFQVFGGRASKIGGYTTLPTNIYTASAQGFSKNTSLTTYYSPVAKDTMIGSFTARPVTPFYFTRTSEDKTDQYQYTLYATDLV